MEYTPETKAQFKWFSIFRVIVVTVVVGSGIYFLRGFKISLFPLYILILLTYFLSVIYWIGFKKKASFTFLLYAGLLLDLCSFTAIVYYTGGFESDFSFLYFFSIITASIFFFVKGGVITASIAIAMYGALLFLEYTNILKPALSFKLVPDINAVGLKLYLHGTFFYIVASLSGYLSERIRLHGEELEEIKVDKAVILENMNSGVIAFNEKGSILYSNEAASKILSVPLKENLADIKVKEFAEYSLKVLEKGQTRKMEEIEVKLPTKESKILAINSSILYSKKGKTRGAIIVFQDLTELKKLQKEMNRMDRLATIGRFSADLAHEIRNPVASLYGAAELLKESESSSKEENTKLLSIIVKEAHRLNEILSHFLKFAKLNPPVFTKVNLNEILDGVIKFTKNEIPEAHNVQISLSDGPPMFIEGDKNQLESAFSNLLSNAVFAVNGKGDISIEIKRPQETYSFLDERTIVPEQSCCIIFKDTGSGIPNKDIDKIFEPFYTTRKQGIGLGLSIVSRIIENHKGYIDVKSKPGKGTIFAIYLPLHQ